MTATTAVSTPKRPWQLPTGDVLAERSRARLAVLGDEVPGGCDSCSALTIRRYDQKRRARSVVIHLPACPAWFALARRRTPSAAGGRP